MFGKVVEIKKAIYDVQKLDLKGVFYDADFNEGLLWYNERPAGTPGRGTLLKPCGYGDKRWTNKVECWGIKNTFCDLSQETAQSSEWYYARVRAAISRRKSGWAVSPRFIPAFTTVVTAPKIKLESTKSSLLIRVRPPHSPHRRRNGTWISMQKLRNLKHRVYILDNKLPDESEKKVYEGCARIILVAKLTSKTFYCVVVETIDVTSGWTSPRSEKRCIRTL
ncbi:I22R2 protein, partial [Polypterus senegalus]|nr:I22R2 protein [Polypterus senegalus]